MVIRIMSCVLLLAATSSINLSNMQISSSENRECNSHDARLSRANGELFLDGKLFSGTIVEKYDGGRMKSTTQYQRGRENGESLGWYPDGSRLFVRRYVEGKKDGEHNGWWENGSMKFRYHFVDGEYDGVQTDWYESGQKSSEFHYNNGEEVGTQQAWRENGKVYVNYIVKDGQRYGLVKTRLCYQVKGEAK